MRFLDVLSEIFNERFLKIKNVEEIKQNVKRGKSGRYKNVKTFITSTVKQKCIKTESCVQDASKTGDARTAERLQLAADKRQQAAKLRQDKEAQKRLQKTNENIG